MPTSEMVTLVAFGIAAAVFVGALAATVISLVVEERR